MCCLGYQPPLFPSQDTEAAVPSVQAFIQYYRRKWRRAREAWIRAGERTKTAADHRRRVAPRYVCGQRVWLLTKDLPLRVPVHKLAPRFIGPYPIVKVQWQSSFGYPIPSIMCILSFMFLRLNLSWRSPVSLQKLLVSDISRAAELLDCYWIFLDYRLPLWTAFSCEHLHDYDRELDVPVGSVCPSPDYFACLT